ncbi:hypothetical protein Lal_00029948 [Lupinus albus]|nr:hypothetical protein Lal_00029948 [Lupinus albus]
MQLRIQIFSTSSKLLSSSLGQPLWTIHSILWIYYGIIGAFLSITGQDYLLLASDLLEVGLVGEDFCTEVGLGGVTSLEKSVWGGVTSLEKSVGGKPTSYEKSVWGGMTSLEKSVLGGVTSLEKSVWQCVTSLEKSKTTLQRLWMEEEMNLNHEILEAVDEIDVSEDENINEVEEFDFEEIDFGSLNEDEV